MIFWQLKASSMKASVLSRFVAKDDHPLFLDLLSKLVHEGVHLQNSPPRFIPREALAAKHILDVLNPFTTEFGGPLLIQTFEYAVGRPNVIITLPGSRTGRLAFVGSHLDVVPADETMWKRPPFVFEQDGDVLWGRGTTDCLGHVALITTLFLQLARAKYDCGITVHAVFIASEEAVSEVGIGLDGLLAHGELEVLKSGPLIWVDSADSQPCVATGGVGFWHLLCDDASSGSLSEHGGVSVSILAPTLMTNAEVTASVLKHLQDVFYNACPAHADEHKYFFTAPSSMKPTQVLTTDAGAVAMSGDTRLTPFRDIFVVKALLEQAVRELPDGNAWIPLAQCPKNVVVSSLKPVTIRFYFEDDDLGNGVLCDMESPGYRALCAATAAVKGKCVPYSDTGSLPLVDVLQAKGFDVQVTGFGLTECYHADNEYCLLSDMKDGFDILLQTVQRYSAEVHPM